MTERQHRLVYTSSIKSTTGRVPDDPQGQRTSRSPPPLLLDALKSYEPFRAKHAISSRKKSSARFTGAKFSTEAFKVGRRIVIVRRRRAYSLVLVNEAIARRLRNAHVSTKSAGALAALDE